MADEALDPIMTGKEECHQAICHFSEAVSYTHLDVYKRQRSERVSRHEKIRN